MTKILETNNYNRFDLCSFNRDVRKTKELEESMRKHGWIDAYPMHVVRNGGDKLLIKAGHHRFIAAQNVGIPVKYVESKDGATIHELESATNQWSLRDYIDSFIRCGKRPYIELQEFHEATGIPLGLCATMLIGNSATGGKYTDVVKSGNLKIGDRAHAETVGDIVNHCVSNGCSWARNTLFVRAISRMVRAKGFDPSVFKQKITKFHGFLEKQPNLERYLDMIDEVYNRQSRVRIPLKFNADQAMRERGESGLLWKKAKE